MLYAVGICVPHVMTMLIFCEVMDCLVTAAQLTVWVTGISGGNEAGRWCCGN